MRGLVLLTLVTGLTACSDDDQPRLLPDAPPPPDAPMVDAPTSGVVTLTITGEEGPVADVQVVFQNADSTVVTEVMTDATGVAMATMEAGGYVTAIDPFQQGVPQLGAVTHDVRTFAGVKPGDQLALTEELFRSASIQTTVQVPADLAATEYLLWGSCLRFAHDITNPGGSASPGPGGPIALNTFDACPTSDFIVETLDATGTSLNAFYMANVTVNPGGNTDLSGGTYAATADASFSYSNVPATILELRADHYLVTAAGPVFSASTFIGVEAGAATGTIKRPAVPAATGVVTTMYDTNQGRQYVIDWGPSTTTYALDLANLPLAAYTERPSFDVATHAFTWTTDPGATPEFARAAAFFTREAPSFQFWRWEIAAPHANNTVTLPVLPGSLATYNPVATDLPDVSQVVTGRVPGGYDAIRAQALNLGFEDLDFEVPDLAVTATGRAQIQLLGGLKVAAPPGKRAPRMRANRPSRIRR